MPIFDARLIELNITVDPTGALSGTTWSNSGGDFLGEFDASLDAEVVGNTSRMNIGDTVDLDGNGTFEGTYGGRFRFGGSDFLLGDGSTISGPAHVIEISVGGTSRYFLIIRDNESAAIDADNLQSVTLGNNFSSPNNTNIGNFDDANSFILVCFAQGTRIRAAQGDVPVEALTQGDMVWTREGGLKAIRWIGSRTVPGHGQNAPIRFDTGVLGNRRPIYVSPQHRMLVDHPMAELLFAESEVLVPAASLVNGNTITRAPCHELTYYHFMFDTHELVEAEGCLAESFYPTKRNISGQTDETQAEMARLFPNMPKGDDWFGEFALPALRGYEGQVLSHAIWPQSMMKAA